MLDVISLRIKALCTAGKFAELISLHMFVNKWVRSVNKRFQHVLWSADRSHNGLTDVSAFDRNDHTRHGLHLNSREKEKLVQFNAKKSRCILVTGKIPVVSGVISRNFFRLKPKSITNYLEDIQISVNKPVLNLEHNQNKIFRYIIKTLQGFQGKLKNYQCSLTVHTHPIFCF
jgi:hypothetical protein